VPAQATTLAYFESSSGTDCKIRFSGVGAPHQYLKKSGFGNFRLL
jgi:hypothetical protein